MTITITALTAGLCTALYVALTVRVIASRRVAKIGLGAGGDAELERRVRIHGNFSEYVPLALVLKAILELNGASRWLLTALGAALFAGRVLHAWGLSRSATYSVGRTAGVALTFFVLVTGAFGTLGYGVGLFPLR
jgi:uncharacterized membrane protein YecN with MAPEG domain